MTHRGAKWADTPPGAIAAGVADMDLAPSPLVLEAARRELDAPAGYPSSAEVARVVEAGTAWAATHHGVALAPTRSVPVSSVAAAAAWVLVRTTEPGDAVVRLTPTYPPLVDAVRWGGRVDRAVGLVGDGGAGWGIDLDALEDACRGARLLLWVAPHNPTGRVWRRTEVEDVARIAARHGLTVVADEVWADVVLTDRAHVPFAAVARDVDARLAARTVTFVTATKPWNLAGLGCGLLHAGADDLFVDLRGDGHVPVVPTPGRVALAASHAAWTQGGPWLASTLDHLRTVVGDAVRRLRAGYGDRLVTAPEGTYCVWLDVRGTRRSDGRAPAERLAVPDGVVATDGAAYDAPGFLRLNLATTASRAATIVDRVLGLVPPAPD